MGNGSCTHALATVLTSFDWIVFCNVKYDAEQFLRSIAGRHRIRRQFRRKAVLRQIKPRAFPRGFLSQHRARNQMSNVQQALREALIVASNRVLAQIAEEAAKAGTSQTTNCGQPYRNIATELVFWFVIVVAPDGEASRIEKAECATRTVFLHN